MAKKTSGIRRQATSSRRKKVERDEAAPDAPETAPVQSAAPEPPKLPAEICVVDCCGVYGWLIPWPLWKCRRLPIVPTRDFERPYIYLYSLAGQLGRDMLAVAPRYPWPATPAILLDDYIDWDSKQVDWHRVALKIEELVISRAREKPASEN